MNPNPNDPAAVTAAALLELRQHPDAVRLISEKLQVKSMGPADHIRTKHEVKTFMEWGDTKAAVDLLKNARARRELNQSQSTTEKLTQQRGQQRGR